jgi:hypothetical protein
MHIFHPPLVSENKLRKWKTTAKEKKIKNKVRQREEKKETKHHFKILFGQCLLLNSSTVPVTVSFRIRKYIAKTGLIM